MTYIQLIQVRVIPLKAGETDINERFFDYKYSLQKAKATVVVPAVTSSTVKIMAKSLAKSWGLSYKYKEGDSAFFEVKYRTKGDKSARTMAFYTGE